MDTKMNTRMYFRRASKVAVMTGSQDLYSNFSNVASLDANLRKLGYFLDDKLALALVHEDGFVVKRLHDDLIAEAKEIKGVRRYSPMYPNFPKQVMEADEAELYINAIVHYFGTAAGVRLMPNYEKLARPELDFDESKLTKISLGSHTDYIGLLVNLLSSKSGFSETDKADVKALSDDDLQTAANFVNRFDNRENKAFVWAEIINRKLEFANLADTATDILRLAVALSDGDTSLADNTKFRNFSRRERRFLLHLLDELKSSAAIAEDMLRHEAAWKRLGEKLHSSEYRGQFPTAASAFDALRNNKVKTFNSQVEKALAQGDSAVSLLKNRPGDFARRLDHVLRSTTNAATRAQIITEFERVARNVSPTVLLQARNAFVTRGSDIRVFFPKGSVAKMQSVNDERNSLSFADRGRVVSVIDAALARIFSSRENLGKVYVDPALKNIAIPFGLRNASRALRTLARGSRLPLDSETGVIRFFIWWKDAKAGGWGYGSHTDVDLSAVVLDDKFNRVFDITYYNLREKGAVHSGDITSAPKGASEFIDIDMNKIKAQGGRYVLMSLNVYSGQKFVELPECFAGFMERADLGSGEIYDPRTVTNKVDLTANSSGATPFIFDLETGEAIWVDLSFVTSRYGNVASAKGQLVNQIEAMAGLRPPSIYDLFESHGAARGTLVKDRDEADLVFALDGDVTPFDTEDILANYL
jgi:hypothetical protein